MKTQFLPSDNRMPKGCMLIETAFPELCIMKKFSFRNNLPLIISKINILGRNNKIVVCSAACLLSNLLSKEETNIEPSLHFAKYGLSLAK